MNTPFEQARDHFLQGLEHLQAGRAAEAEAALLASLALVPGRPSSLQNLAVARLALDRPAQAADALLQVLQAEPDNGMAWSHLGQARLALGQAVDAVAAFNRAWSLGPPSAALRYHRTRALAAAGQPHPAWDSLQPLLDPQVPTAAPAWQLAGQVLQMLQQHDEAARHYQQALTLDRTLGRCWLLLGQLHQMQRQHDAAREAFTQAQEHGENAELVQYLLAGLAAAAAEQADERPAQASRGRQAEGANAGMDRRVLAATGVVGASTDADVGRTSASAVPPASPATYVRSLFDPYAEGFDEHLVQTLRYSGHTAVADAALEDSRPLWRSALDLGCGTGLCGARVRPHTQRLTGVDLSPTMVEHARRREVYDALHTEDVVQHLAHTSDRHDLILAADVFIYIGDLAPVMAGVRRVLAPDGRFVFSIERDDAAHTEQGFVLRASLRYAHAPAVLARLAAEAGLTVDGVRPIVLREEEGRPIHGAVLVLRPVP